MKHPTTSASSLWRRLWRRTLRPAALTSARRRDRLAHHLLCKGIVDSRVLQTVRDTPRHLFMPPPIRHEAYQDKALPIGQEQTISQPYVVALMSQALALKGHERVLEVGTGSGYQTAILSSLCGQVYTIEILPGLSDRARDVLGRLGRDNIQFRVGDGWCGWQDQAPFDAIIVTAAPTVVPQALLDQLAVGGRLVVPVGEQHETQTLWCYEKRGQQAYASYSLGGVLFVPMTGRAQQVWQR